MAVGVVNVAVAILAVALTALAITIESLVRVAKSIPPQPESETTR